MTSIRFFSTGCSRANSWLRRSSDSSGGDGGTGTHGATPAEDRRYLPLASGAVNRDDLLATLHIEVDPEARVLDLDADEPTLDDVPDASVDGAIRLTRRGPKAALGELAELGRILRPGGWAIMRIS